LRAHDDGDRRQDKYQRMTNPGNQAREGRHAPMMRPLTSPKPTR